MISSLCASCQQPFKQRPNKRFCSNRCRLKAWGEARGLPKRVEPASVEQIEVAVRHYLEMDTGAVGLVTVIDRWRVAFQRAGIKL